MGMYDLVKIHKDFLPYPVNYLEVEWQTKSYNRVLVTLIIDKDGKLFLNYLDEDGTSKFEDEFLPHTGEIKFYTSVVKVW